MRVMRVMSGWLGLGEVKREIDMGCCCCDCDCGGCGCCCPGVEYWLLLRGKPLWFAKEGVAASGEVVVVDDDNEDDPEVVALVSFLAAAAPAPPPTAALLSANALAIFASSNWR